jgi:hypothetical protein
VPVRWSDRSAARLKTSVLPTTSHARWQQGRSAVASTVSRPKPDLNGLHKHILSWSFDSLDESELPTVDSVPDSFQDIEDYIGRFEPLLVHECHAHINKARDDIGPSPDNSLCMQLRKASLQRIDAFTFVTFEFLDDKAKMPRQHDVLALLSSNMQASNVEEHSKILCMVDNLKPVAGARTRKRGSKHRELRVKIYIPDGVSGRMIRNQLQQSSWVACNVMNLTTLEVCCPHRIVLSRNRPGSDSTA